MQLPDGTTLMHGKRPYDPVKAREYYLKTRKLKGRRKGSVAPPESKRPDQIRYRKSLDAFLKKLPMAKEGATVQETEAFVDSFRDKTDAELKMAIRNMKDTPGRKDGQIKAQTVLALLENRARVRSQKADAKKTAKKNTKMKAEVKPGTSKKNLIKTG